jgi:hypothetical protein
MKALSYMARLVPGGASTPSLKPPRRAFSHPSDQIDPTDAGLHPTFRTPSGGLQPSNEPVPGPRSERGREPSPPPPIVTHRALGLTSGAGDEAYPLGASTSRAVPPARGVARGIRGEEGSEEAVDPLRPAPRVVQTSRQAGHDPVPRREADPTRGPDRPPPASPTSWPDQLVDLHPAERSAPRPAPAVHSWEWATGTPLDVGPMAAPDRPEALPGLAGPSTERMEPRPRTVTEDASPLLDRGPEPRPPATAEPSPAVSIGTIEVTIVPPPPAPAAPPPAPQQVTVIRPYERPTRQATATWYGMAQT